MKSLESDFLYHKPSFPIESAGMDVNRPDIARQLKQVCGLYSSATLWLLEFGSLVGVD